MKLIHNLARVRHAVYGNVLMGALATAAGLVQTNQAFEFAGIAWIFISATALVLTYTAERGVAEMTFRLEGVIVEPQQPQLPDVQMRTHRTPELSRGA